MFPQLSSVLGEAEAAAVVVLVEADADRAAFLLHHFLSAGLRGGGGVFVLGLEQSFGHYHSVGLKLGHNLVKLREAGNLVFHEGLRKVLEGGGVLAGGSGGQESLRGLYREVVEAAAGCQVVLVDNLAVLALLGHSPSAVTAFLHQLRRHLGRRGARLVVRATLLPGEGAWARAVALAQLGAGLVLRVEGLPTGHSRCLGDSGLRAATRDFEFTPF